MTQNPLRIGIAGLGTVGTGVVEALTNNKDLLRARSGRDIEIVSVFAKNKDKDRGLDLSSYQWPDDPFDMLNNIDCLVELIGGSEGIAKDLVEAALNKGIHIVTANKALLAHHGYSFEKIAEEKGVSIYGEACVAGGIPVVKSLREGLSSNEITGVYGILNGTCNYILTQMLETGRSFDDVLKEAQDLGYAEADPHFDVDGIDTAHKICLLASMSYSVRPNLDLMDIRGIREVTLSDLKHADRLGYKIKLLGHASIVDGLVTIKVEPCLVPKGKGIGAVDGVLNAVLMEGDLIGQLLNVGPGAGKEATASSVVADLVDLCRRIHVPLFNVKTDALAEAKPSTDLYCTQSFYVRIPVSDKAGVMAHITKTMSDNGLSLDVVRQDPHDSEHVSIVMITHPAQRPDLEKAIQAIVDDGMAAEAPKIYCVKAL
jgi:homoserine dehydrogenase